MILTASAPADASLIGFPNSENGRHHPDDYIAGPHNLTSMDAVDHAVLTFAVRCCPTVVHHWTRSS
jgi:hypothetical protein